jgi:hypothetical protein
MQTWSSIVEEREMKNRRTLAVRTREPQPMTTTSEAPPAVRFRDVGRRHAEAALAEVAPTIRRFRLLLTMMIVCIPVSVVGGLVLLWRLG